MENKRKHETVKCGFEGCNRDIDIRGIKAHMEKHQRETMRKGLHVVGAGAAVPETQGQVVKAFELGWRLGRQAA